MSETAIRLLPGQIAMALLAAAAIAYPLARLLLWRYVRSVEAAMRSLSPNRSAAPTAGIAAPAPVRPASAFTAEALLSRLKHAPWRAAAIQAGVAPAVALYFGALQLIAADISLSAYRVIALAATHLWPGVIAVLMIAGISWRQRAIVLAIGAALYLLLGIWAYDGPIEKAVPALGVLWGVTNLPPSLYLLAFMTRRVRAIGPLVLLVTLTTATGVIAALAVFQESEALLTRVAEVLVGLGLDAVGAFVVIVLVSAAIAFVAGWILLRILAGAYARYSVGDEGLTLAAMWLSFIAMNSIGMVFGNSLFFLLGLLGFPLYLVLVRIARFLFLPRSGGAAPALLLLRVFARKGPTTGLFHAISRHWRHVGPIRMIAGYDLAGDTVEPDEMMAFLRRRLAESFVTGPEVVARRLHAAAPRRDADGRYRSEEFFCFDDTWRDTLRSLVASSSVVLMDLRGFGPDNQGCVFELQALAEFGALSRTVLVHDGTTRMATLHEALRAIGIDAAALRLLAVRNEQSHDIPALLAALAEHATRR